MTSILQRDENHSQVRLAYYDIESLANVFTLSIWEPGLGRIDVFYLIDPSMEELHQSGFAADAGDDGFRSSMITAIRACNPYLADWNVPDGSIRFHDLRTQSSLLLFGAWFGVSDAYDMYRSQRTVEGHSHFPARMAPVTDMMDVYDPVSRHPYLIGFNSDSYDTTMLAIFFYEVYAAWVQRLNLTGVVYDDMMVMKPSDLAAPQASLMRQYNDTLFAEYDSYMPMIFNTPKDGYHPTGMGVWDDKHGSVGKRIHRNFIGSGRHIDAKPLNEHNKYVSLKRLLGMMGLQILESEHLSQGADRIDTIEDFRMLVAYNVSDVLGLGWLFEQDGYAAQFDLKTGLMRTYPQTVLTPSAFKDWQARHGHGEGSVQ